MEVSRIDAPGQGWVVVPTAPLSPEQRAEQDRLIHAVREVNQTLFAGQQEELTFSLDPATRRPVFKLVDRRTQEVIRQIPPEYLLRLAEEMKGTEQARQTA